MVTFKFLSGSSPSWTHRRFRLLGGATRLTSGSPSKATFAMRLYGDRIDECMANRLDKRPLRKQCNPFSYLGRNAMRRGPPQGRLHRHRTRVSSRTLVIVGVSLVANKAFSLSYHLPVAPVFTTAGRLSTGGVPRKGHPGNGMHSLPHLNKVSGGSRVQSVGLPFPPPPPPIVQSVKASPPLPRAGRRGAKGNPSGAPPGKLPYAGRSKMTDCPFRRGHRRR